MRACQRALLYDADFVALPVDPVNAPPQDLLKAKVLLNVVAGAVVYDGMAAR
ncbi:hypothetical protein JQX13_11045 [Archangium violaceum]|uniref:hypothetical protein n=1 Tax=Archangium violaceum TaxID=83451 RepID=UPI00193C1503|nr:hypothetical protein [Archangium violaceum]QRK10573.1 hypothetical protein JQX13_11045 [Archangium violaceum]